MRISNLLIAAYEYAMQQKTKQKKKDGLCLYTSLSKQINKWFE
jgi:hypothetical protein